MFELLKEIPSIITAISTTYIAVNNYYNRKFPERTVKASEEILKLEKGDRNFGVHYILQSVTNMEEGHGYKEYTEEDYPHMIVLHVYLCSYSSCVPVYGALLYEMCEVDIRRENYKFLGEYYVIPEIGNPRNSASVDVWMVIDTRNKGPRSFKCEYYSSIDGSKQTDIVKIRTDDSGHWKFEVEREKTK